MLPGSGAEDFFESWLKFGTGGTCWSGAGACHALLTSLGFDAGRGVGTMLIVPSLPPNHGTVVVAFARELYLVDCSMLHGEPLQLTENSAVTHRAWGVGCSRRDDRWHISWRPLNKVEGLVCRLESVAASAEDFAAWYETTRSLSPFNYELCARINRGTRDRNGFGHLVPVAMEAFRGNRSGTRSDCASSSNRLASPRRLLAAFPRIFQRRRRRGPLARRRETDNLSPLRRRIGRSFP
jgi:arylamine N-acetyltransferase